MAETQEPSPPVIVNAPGGVVSVNQQGGITAGVVNIGAVAPPLALSAAQQAAVRVAATGLQGKIDVIVDQPTPAYLAFGQALASALSDAGLTVQFVTVGAYVSIECPKQLGLRIGFGRNRKGAAEAIAGALRQSGVVAAPVNACQVGDPDELKFIISS